MDRPFGMLAEITYACPLHCPYCSNALNLADYRKELTTEEWQRVLTGDAARRDPVCHLSPDHQIVADAVRAANEEPGKADFVPRVRTVHRG